jgi:hypothetical protein
LSVAHYEINMNARMVFDRKTGAAFQITNDGGLVELFGAFLTREEARLSIEGAHEALAAEKARLMRNNVQRFEWRPA